ncbi:glycosyltransferase family 61 protein [Gluconobacter sp. LMG 31484]|uniref:Glycosyltransferase family 61 protein n=1 Tax=Gluconobacter vitians TaxID=2728102 RepID=A0ABR9Y8X0_9PROT|nr:glycosyltransferase 61 family protein [Gluconobacter vitians]MBF0860292.1 glycosyltransferase family 61 protein [Gluconobacter vitians]
MFKKALANDISKRIFSEPPALYSYHNVLFIPQSPIGIDKKSGLYDSHGNLINQAAIFSGEENNLHIHVQEYKTRLSFHDEYPEFESFFWGGYFSDHYGHFLIETLPRLMRYSFIKYEKNIKIIFLSKNSKETLIKIKWVKYFLDLLEIDFDDIFIPLFPIKIKKIEFCSDYISEQNYANKNTNRIFSHFFKKENKSANENKFAYISRKNLMSGTHKIQNEEKLENILSRFGVSIFYSEELSVPEQINIIKNYKCAGFLGSFFHNCLFSSNKVEFLCISYGEKINMNYSLIDFISNASGDYYVQKLNVLGNEPGFYEVCSIDNIEDVSNFIMLWFNSRIDRNPSYFLKENIYRKPSIDKSSVLKIKDIWNRSAKISPHTCKVIFIEENTPNDILVDVVVVSTFDGKNYLMANSSYCPPIKIGGNCVIKNNILVFIEKNEEFFNIKINEEGFLTSIPKNGYSVSDLRPSHPDEWEKFFLTPYTKDILID